MKANWLLLRLLPCMGALVLAGAALAAPVSFAINVSTPTGPGYLDFQFNPGFEAAEATATISRFRGGTLLAPVDTVFPLPFNTATASGDLETEVAISNAGSFNAFLQRLDFGLNFALLVTLSEPALNTTGNGGGTDFSMFHYDQDGNTMTGGPLLILAIGPDAEITQSLGPGVSVAAIPEPASILGVSSALLLLIHVGYLRKWKRRTGSGISD